MTFITIIKYYNSKHVSGYSDYYFIFACSTSSIIGIATCWTCQLLIGIFNKSLSAKYWLNGQMYSWKRALCPLSGVHLTIKPTFLSIWGIYHNLPSIFCSRLPDECTIWKSKVWFSTDFISDDLKLQRISWRSKVSRTEERFCICPVNVPLGNCRQSICSVILPGRLLSNLTKIVISTLSADHCITLSDRSHIQN